MTLAEARKLVTEKRLIFGQSNHIESVEVMELAKKASAIGSFHASCPDCGGYGSCSCEACSAGDYMEQECPNDGVCKKCDGEGWFVKQVSGEAAESLTADDFREALVDKAAA